MYTELAIDLFPSVFYAVEIRENIDQELQELKQVSFVNHESDYGDSKSYSSESFKILDTQRLLKKTLNNYVVHFKNDVLGYTNTKLSITSSWVTKTEPGGYSELHDHKNSWYSGVLYFDDIDDCGNLCITDDSKSYLLNNPPEENSSIRNAETFIFAPKKNNLVLFPSYLKHRVTKNNSDQDRYSLAFNIFPTSNFGQNDSALHISIK